MAGCCRFCCKVCSLYQPCFNCSRRVPTALGLAGRAGRLPGLVWGLPRRCCCRGGTAQLSPGPLCWGPGQHHSTLLPVPLSGGLTSYSWENFSPSLALSRSMLSERSVTGMGGWSRMPASKTRREEGEENGYGSAWPRKAQQEHVHSKPKRWVQGGHV